MIQREPVTPGGIYEHYKGDLYIVLHVVEDSENVGNRGKMVVYMSLSEPQIGRVRMRSLVEFCEDVEKPDGGVTRRFKFLRQAPR